MSKVIQITLQQPNKDPALMLLHPELQDVHAVSRTLSSSMASKTACTFPLLDGSITIWDFGQAPVQTAHVAARQNPKEGAND